VFIFYVVNVFFIPDYGKAEWFLINSYISGYLFYTLLSLKWKIEDKLENCDDSVDESRDSQTEILVINK
jgi:hypothetical protein